MEQDGEAGSERKWIRIGVKWGRVRRNDAIEWITVEVQEPCRIDRIPKQWIDLTADWSRMWL